MIERENREGGLQGIGGSREALARSAAPGERDGASWVPWRRALALARTPRMSRSSFITTAAILLEGTCPSEVAIRRRDATKRASDCDARRRTPRDK